MTTVSVKLPQVLSSRLESAAAERGVSKSAVIRRALEREFGGKKGKRSGSFLARANDLVGRVAGPRDLSHAARYLRGYGR